MISNSFACSPTADRRMIVRRPLTFKNTRSSGRASWVEEGLFDKKARRTWLKFRLDDSEVVDFWAFIMVVWEWLCSLRAVPSQRGW